MDVEAFEQAASTARGSREPAAYEAALTCTPGNSCRPTATRSGQSNIEGGCGRSTSRFCLGLARLHEERADVRISPPRH